MQSTFRPAWWLPGAHSMTMWGKFFRTADLTGMELGRLPTPDGDDLTLASGGPPDADVGLLLLHGLEGGLRSHYAGGILAAARRRGWRSHYLVFRTCDGRMNRTRRTYHSGETTDLDLVIRHLAATSPSRIWVLVGVSLGGNVLLKWLGESGQSIPASVRAAAAVSTPYDLARSSRAIGRGFARLYQWNFLRSLKAKALRKLVSHPDVGARERIGRIRTLWEFDDLFTAPVHGFRDAADYYERSSSIRVLDRIRIPTLLLSSFDDPFHPPDVLRDVLEIAKLNGQLHAEFQPRGGHVGFVGGPPWRPRYYVDDRVIDFLAAYVTAPATLQPIPG